MKVGVDDGDGLVRGVRVLWARVSDFGKVLVNVDYITISSEAMTKRRIHALVHPLYMTRPTDNRVSRSNNENTSQFGWWIVAIQIIFVSRAKRLTAILTD